MVARRYQLKPRKERQRRIGGGRKGDLPSDEDKLLYILIYLKIYPTYDVLSVLSNHQRSKCGDSVKLLLPTLETALGRKLVLPKRKVGSLEEVFKRCPELKDVFLDGYERRTQVVKARPSLDIFLKVMCLPVLASTKPLLLRMLMTLL